MSGAIGLANWFLGFPVSAEGWFDALSPPPDGTRLLAPADLHMTLAFFGPVEASRARAAFESIPRDAIGAFEIGLGPIVPMGHPKRFSALSARIEILSADAPALLERLSSLRDRLLDTTGLRRDRRAMMPHVTLARVGRKASREERDRALGWAASEKLVSTRLPLDRIALYTAHRSRNVGTRGGPRTSRAYDIVDSRDLRGATNGDRRDSLHPAEQGLAPSARE